MKEEFLGHFSVNADWTGQVYLTCSAEEPYWCFWEGEVPNGATLSEMLKIGTEHHKRTHAPNGLCADRIEHEPHDVVTGSLAPYRCTGDPADREPGRSERRRGQ